ncbi:MAG: hypothetical protein AB7O96_03140 [Pseudobdellovibrionaceae bacterium]
MKSLVLVISLFAVPALATEGWTAPYDGPYEKSGMVCSFKNNKLWIYLVGSPGDTWARAQIYNQSANKFTKENLTLTPVGKGRLAINRTLGGYKVGYIEFSDKTQIFSAAGEKLSTCRPGQVDSGTGPGGGGDGGGFFP